MKSNFADAHGCFCSHPARHTSAVRPVSTGANGARAPWRRPGETSASAPSLPASADIVSLSEDDMKRKTISRRARPGPAPGERERPGTIGLRAFHAATGEGVPGTLVVAAVAAVGILRVVVAAARGMVAVLGLRAPPGPVPVGRQGRVAADRHPEPVARLPLAGRNRRGGRRGRDRKSTRLNSSHVKISYAVFCLKKKIL